MTSKISKFKDHFLNNQVIEWKLLYIDYVTLKELLEPFQSYLTLYKEQIENEIKQSFVPISGREAIYTITILQDELKKNLNQLDINFFDLFKAEIEKANTFVELHIQHLQAKVENLRLNLSQYLKIETKKVQNDVYFQLREFIKLMYKECYMLQCFIIANRQAAQRLGMHYQRKAFYLENFAYHGLEIMRFEETTHIFHENTEIQQIMDELKDQLKSIFYENDTQQCEEVLSTVLFRGFQNQKIVLGFGICLGLALNMMFSILMSKVKLSQNINIKYDIYFPMFRCIGLFLFYYWLLICNVLIWKRTKINYKLIFGFNHHYSDKYRLLRRASSFTMFYLLIFMFSINQEIQNALVIEDQQNFIRVINFLKFQPTYGPLIIWIFLLIYFFVPLNLFNYQGRKFFWKLNFRVFFAIFQPINFPVVWLSVQYLTFAIPLRDFLYTICFYKEYFNQKNDLQVYQKCSQIRNGTPGLIIAVIPLSLSIIIQLKQAKVQNKFFGTVQSYNLLKNSIAMLTTIISFFSTIYPSFFNLWIFFATSSACFLYYCDLVKDWNFFQPNTKHRFLRKQLAYEPWFYYIIMIVNLPLRMAWILQLSPNNFEIWGPLFVFILSSIEIVRIFLWNLIRVEREHVVNVGEFKVILEIDLPYKNIGQIDYESQNSSLNDNYKINTSKTESSNSNITVFAEENFLFEQVKRESNYKEFKQITIESKDTLKERFSVSKKLKQQILDSLSIQN